MATLSIPQSVNRFQEVPQRQMRDPEAWVGKQLPKNLHYEQWTGGVSQYDFCDHCGHWHKMNDLHNPVYPTTEYGWWMQEQLRIEEAQGFCPDCYDELTSKAEKIDPEWQRKTIDGGDIPAPDALSNSPRSVNAVPISESVPLTSTIVRNTITSVELTYAGREFRAWYSDGGYYYVRDEVTRNVVQLRTSQDFDRFLVRLCWYAAYKYGMEGE